MDKGLQVRSTTDGGCVIVADHEWALVLFEAFNLGIEGVMPAERALEPDNVGQDVIDETRGKMDMIGRWITKHEHPADTSTTLP